MNGAGPRIGLLWRGTPSERPAARLDGGRFEVCAAALRVAGLAPEPCVYAEEVEAEVEAQLDGIAAILVWVNPLHEGRNRDRLDALLRSAAARGALVSAHPDTILKIGTKEVLYRTAGMPWGSDVHLYSTPDELRDRLPTRLASAGRLVLKQNRGQSGLGVWLVECESPDQRPGPEMPVRVREAPRNSKLQAMPLHQFIQLCAGYFANGAPMIDQPYVARLPEGMTRCYMVGARIAGFGHQAINALHPAPKGAPPEAAPQAGPRLYSGPDDARFQRLRGLMEEAWIPQLLATVGMDAGELPMLWDADFLLGPKTATGEDSYVLCEINVSSVSPFPDSAAAPLAAEVVRRLSLRVKLPPL